MDELDETVLTIAQRHQRAMIMRRNQNKIERARELAQKRLAPEKNIKKRAYAQARQIVRAHVAGKRGAEYEKLGPSEKVIIDRAIDKKAALIKKIALRLIPRVKQAEQKRLSTFIKGKSVENHGQPEGKTTEPSINEKFTTNFPSKPKETKASTKNVIMYSTFDDEANRASPVAKSIKKKADKSGIDEAILGKVYDRGMEAWTEETGVSQQQYAFARVNSFINQGKTYFNEDSDLQELSRDTLSSYVDKASDAKLHRKLPTKKVDNRYRGVAQALKKGMEESNNTPYVKPHIEKGSTEQSGWKASNKHGKVKYFGMDFKKSAERHAGLQEAQINEMGGDQYYSDTTGAASGGGKGTPISAKKATKDATNLLNKKFKEALKKEEVQQTNENFIDGKGPGKPGDAARHGLTGKSASELKKIRSSETASPRKKQLAHWMLNMHHNEETELDELSATTINAYRRGMEKDVAMNPEMDPKKKERRLKGFKTSTHKVLGIAKVNATEGLKDPEDNPCWKGYKPVGTKKKGGKTVPNCVPMNEEERPDPKVKVEGTNCRNCVYWRKDLEKPVTKEELNPNGGLKAPNIEYIAMSKRIDLGTLPGKDSSVKIKGFCDHDTIKDWVTERMCCSQWDSDGMIRDYKGQSPVMEEGESILPQTTSKGSKIRKKIEVVDRKPPYTDYTRQAEIKTKVIDEEHPNCGTDKCCGQCGGNAVNDPKKRLVGTDSLVKAYKKDTPFAEDINESFNIAYAAGVGVTLTAADLGMRAKSGFAHHPSVIEQMDEMEEEVRSADVKGVVVRTASGKTVVRKQKVDRKIIGTGSLTDGKPDDTL